LSLPCGQCAVCNPSPYQEKRAIDGDPEQRAIEQRIVFRVEHCVISSRIYRRLSAVLVSEYAKYFEQFHSGSIIFFIHNLLTAGKVYRRRAAGVESPSNQQVATVGTVILRLPLGAGIIRTDQSID
jgi:hypothetical protein